MRLGIEDIENVVAEHVVGLITRPVAVSVAAGVAR